MKKFALLLSATVILAACGGKKTESKVTVIEGGMKLCESAYVYGDKLIIPSFGSENLEPLNEYGLGYVSAYENGEMSVMIPNDGTLSAPKGTLVKDNRLFIADVGKLVVYNLNAPHSGPQIIHLPAGDTFVNDMAVHGNKMFITVTNTGNIYTLDTTPSVMVNPETLTFYTNVPGVNGILIHGDSMYLASSDSQKEEENVLYFIEDINAPEITAITDIPGAYDGLAMNDDATRLYYTNWKGGEVGYYDIKSKELVKLDDTGVTFAGPARLAYDKGTLYIPDMPNSRLVIYKAE